MSEMNEMTETAAEIGRQFFLEDQARWESLGFDWESWNATVERILERQSSVRSNPAAKKAKKAERGAKRGR